MTLRTLIRVTMALGVVSLIATGCGRRGDLDLPSTPVEQQNKRNHTVKPKVEDKPFVFDALL